MIKLKAFFYTVLAGIFVLFNNTVYANPISVEEELTSSPVFLIFCIIIIAIVIFIIYKIIKAITKKNNNKNEEE